MFPQNYGTVDQFAVKALCGVSTLPEIESLKKMKPMALTPANGAMLIGIMARKAADNNRLFKTTVWTPRKIDQILWTYGR